MPLVAVSNDMLTSFRLNPNVRAAGWSYSIVSTGICGSQLVVISLTSGLFSMMTRVPSASLVKYG